MVVTTNFVSSNDRLTDFSTKFLKGCRVDCMGRLQFEDECQRYEYVNMEIVYNCNLGIMLYVFFFPNCIVTDNYK